MLLTLQFAICVVCLLVLVAVLLRVVYVLRKVLANRESPLAVKKEAKAVKTLVILGSGGHTAEMIRLLGGIKCSVYFPREYVVADTDNMSVKKVEAFENWSDSGSTKYNVHVIPRSREVGQSWISTFLTTFYACLYAIVLVLRIRPGLVLCNGPGTCIPLCGAAFLFRVLGIKDSKTVYVESICRVKSLSLSGKILYWFADHVLVQWPDLVEIYPRTKYIGRLS